MTEKTIVEINNELKELIPWYLDNRINDIKKIRDALEKADYETIRLLGHSMKGSGGGYGFEQITWIGKAIEQAAILKDASAVLTQIELLQNYINNIDIRYKD